jgi:hypothetical protein
MRAAVSTVSERQRLELYERLGETLGKEHAEVLMDYLPPVGWNDVARRHDLELLRLELRAEMEALRADVHEQLSRQLVWLVGTILASVGAVLGLIAYVN